MTQAATTTLPGLALGVLLLVADVGTANAGEAVNKDRKGLAIHGYDPVAYYTEGRPIEGVPDYEHEWHGARWRFATAEHRDRFESDPEAYAPRYGGFCAGGMALGRKARIDPTAWAIVDGRLYLNYSKRDRDKFALDSAAKIAKADANWASLGQE